MLCVLLNACGGGGGGGNNGGTLPNTAQLLEIQVTPVSSSIALGAPVQFKATGRFDDDTVFDITYLVNWTSSNTNVATADTVIAGRMIPVAVGKTDIIASLGGLSAATQLTVQNAALQSLHIIPDKLDLAVGNIQTLKVMGQYSDGSERDVTAAVTWTSVDSNVTGIQTNAAGDARVVANGVGSTIINATLSHIAGRSSVTVSDATLDKVDITLVNQGAIPAEGVSLVKGVQLQLKAYGTYSDASVKDITLNAAWSVTDSTIASFSKTEGQQGLLLGLLPGSTTISVSVSTPAGGSVDASVGLTVTDALLQTIDITPATATVTENQSQVFTATGHYSDGSSLDITSQVLWTSSNTNALTISNADGEHGIARAFAGPVTVTITAQMQTNSGTVSNTASVNVAQDLTAPVAVNVTASPDLIFHYADSATLTAIVQAADSTLQVPDGTVVDFTIVDGVGNLSSATAPTSNGQAQATLTSSVVGTVKVKATVQGASIENYALITVTDDFASNLVSQASQNVTTTSDGLVVPKSSFVFNITNYTSRTYKILEYDFYIGADTSVTPLLTNTKFTDFSNGTLPTDKLLSITATLPGPDNYTATIYTGVYTFQDPATMQTFTISHTFTVP